MIRARTVAEVESDLAALKAAAERAGIALACLFSSAAEFEAEIIRLRRAQGAFPPPPYGGTILAGTVLKLALTATLAATFLML
jgi:hypothetical protein